MAFTKLPCPLPHQGNHGTWGRHSTTVCGRKDSPKLSSDIYPGDVTHPSTLIYTDSLYTYKNTSSEMKEEEVGMGEEEEETDPPLPLPKGIAPKPCG